MPGAPRPTACWPATPLCGAPVVALPNPWRAARWAQGTHSSRDPRRPTAIPSIGCAIARVPWQPCRGEIALSNISRSLLSVTQSSQSRRDQPVAPGICPLRPDVAASTSMSHRTFIGLQHCPYAERARKPSQAYAHTRGTWRLLQRYCRDPRLIQMRTP